MVGNQTSRRPSALTARQAAAGTLIFRATSAFVSIGRASEVEGKGVLLMGPGRLERMRSALRSALATLVATAPAAADHGGPLRSAPMSPLTAAILFAGLALLVGAVVIVVVRVLTKDRGVPEDR